MHRTTEVVSKLVEILLSELASILLARSWLRQRHAKRTLTHTHTHNSSACECTQKQCLDILLQPPTHTHRDLRTRAPPYTANCMHAHIYMYTYAQTKHATSYPSMYAYTKTMYTQMCPCMHGEEGNSSVLITYIQENSSDTRKLCIKHSRDKMIRTTIDIPHGDRTATRLNALDLPPLPPPLFELYRLHVMPFEGCQALPATKSQYA